MNGEETRVRAAALMRRLRGAKTSIEQQEVADELAPMLESYWVDVGPHSSMEMLLAAVIDLPVATARGLVRDVVRSWRREDGYDPHAGGNAAGCYLWALILSDNIELAEHPWVDELLPREVQERRPSWFEGMRDAQRKEQIVREVEHRAA